MYPQFTIQITWPTGWMIIVPVPRIQFDHFLNRYDHFKLDVHGYISHIDWCIVTEKDVRIVSERVAYNAGWV